MSPSELERAIKALREIQDGRSLAASRTETGIIDALEKRRPHASRVRWGLPLAAVCVASSAFAATHPEAVRAVRDWLTAPSLPAKRRGAVALEAEAPAVLVTGDGSPMAAASSSLVPQQEASRPPQDEPRGTSASVEAIRTRIAVVPSSAAALETPERVDAKSAPKPTEETDAKPAPLDIFRTASRLHFSGRDPAGALAAWERYLAVDPHGPLALEARYYRGLCLVELGRITEGKDALQPFAEGRYGSYRTAEARRVLNKLEPAAP